MSSGYLLTGLYFQWLSKIPFLPTFCPKWPNCWLFFTKKQVSEQMLLNRTKKGISNEAGTEISAYLQKNAVSKVGFWNFKWNLNFSNPEKQLDFGYTVKRITSFIQKLHHTILFLLQLLRFGQLRLNFWLQICSKAFQRHDQHPNLEYLSRSIRYEENLCSRNLFIPRWPKELNARME